MKPNSRRLFGAAVGAALGVIAIEWYFLSRRSPTPHTATPAPEATAPNDSAAAPSPGPVEGAEASLIAQPGDVARTEVDDGALMLPHASVWLEGLVRSKSTPMHKVTLITLPSSGNGERSSGLGRSVTAKPAADGTFAIDISRAFAVGAPFPKVMLLQATRDAGSSHQIEVPVVFDARALDGDAPVRLIAELELPEMCTATGKAWLMGDLAQSVQVAAFELIEGVPARHASALGVADAREHVYELPLVCGRDYIVVAYREGYRPRVHRLGSEDLYTVDAFALEPGEPIRGTAEFRGAPLRGRVAARPNLVSAGTAQHAAGSANFVWQAEQFEWSEVTSDIGANGEFELLGLAPATYEVVLAHISGVAARRAASAVVNAPADGVRLAPELAELRLVVTQGGRPYAGKSVALIEHSAEGRKRAFSAHTDAEGVAVIWLAPLVQIDIDTFVKATTTSGASGTSTTLRLGD